MSTAHWIPTLRPAFAWIGVLGTIVLLLAGCGEDLDSQPRKTKRVELFEKCMDLAAKVPRQPSDKVSDIVSQCSTESWYMTN